MSPLQTGFSSCEAQTFKKQPRLFYRINITRSDVQNVKDTRARFRAQYSSHAVTTALERLNLTFRNCNVSAETSITHVNSFFVKNKKILFCKNLSFMWWIPHLISFDRLLGFHPSLQVKNNFINYTRRKTQGGKFNPRRKSYYAYVKWFLENQPLVLIRAQKKSNFLW